MNKLDLTNPLFENLEKNPPGWWKTLVNERDIYIDIRKKNTIDVYYSGGAIIKELSFKSGHYKGKINYKYLQTGKSEYITYSLNEKEIMPNQSIDLLSFEDFEDDILKRIKANIRNYYSASSEKGIQAKFIIKSGFFIDSEFAYPFFNKNSKKESTIRIDLIWLDVVLKKIVLVELKTMGDSRLFTYEITNQLSSFRDFATKNKKALEDYYYKIFELKRKLCLLPKELDNIEHIRDFSIEPKPLLLFGDCEQDWINNNALHINSRI